MHAQPVNSASGYYGKAPATGDFIKHNLPRAFIEPWDDWLQTLLAFSKEQMADEWLDIYLTSPIYRFVLTPGICGELGWRGVVMPSVDRVGRYFPMTICSPLGSGKNPFQYILQESQWFSKAESLVLSVLEDNFSAESLNASLNTLGETDQPTSTTASIALPRPDDKLSGSMAFREPLPADDSDTLPLHQNLLHSLLLETGFAYSLWRTTGSEKVSSSLLLTQGLPPAKSGAAMMDGNWSGRGWMDSNLSLAVSGVPNNQPAPWDS